MRRSEGAVRGSEGGRRGERGGSEGAGGGTEGGARGRGTSGTLFHVIMCSLTRILGVAGPTRRLRGHIRAQDKPRWQNHARISGPRRDGPTPRWADRPGRRAPPRAGLPGPAPACPGLPGPAPARSAPVRPPRPPQSDRPAPVRPPRLPQPVPARTGRPGPVRAHLVLNVLSRL